MSDKTNDDYGILKYRVEKLEEMIKPLIDLVNNLDKKISLLTQKIVIATILLGSLFQGAGVWYSVHGSKAPAYNEQDKQKYYESRISDSEKIKELEKELYQLRNKK
jgi:hypothetical protein